MNSKLFGLLLPLLVALPFWTTTTCSGSAAADGRTSSNASESGQAAPDLTGTWSGTLVTENQKSRPVPITVVISRDSKGALFATSSLSSDCVKNPRLQVTVTSSAVVLAGSDADGNSLTLRGTLDKAGTLLTMNFIANGSASGRCQTINGTGTLRRRAPLH